MNSLIRLVAFVGLALCFSGHARSQNCFDAATKDCVAGVDVSCAANICRTRWRNPNTGIWQLQAEVGWESAPKCGEQQVIDHEVHFTNAINVPVVVPYIGESGHASIPNGIVNCKQQGNCHCRWDTIFDPCLIIGELTWVDKINSFIVDTTIICVEN